MNRKNETNDLIDSLWRKFDKNNSGLLTKSEVIILFEEYNRETNGLLPNIEVFK